MIRIKICALLAAVAMAWSLEAASAGNSLVQVSTSCADVLSLKCVGKDFHLLVTNANVTATVSVTAVNPPYLLVLPESGECTVSLGSSATYKVKKQQPKEEEKDNESEVSGKIIMFRPDFTVRSDVMTENPKKASVSGDLTDNFTAKVDVICNGIANLSGHSPRMTVAAVNKSERLVNNVGIFSINVSIDENSLVWPTSKTYWYGEQMPSADYDWDVWDKCCASYNSPYEFVLMVDGIACVRKVYTVGSPNEDPRMKVISPVRDSNYKWPCICSISRIDYSGGVYTVMLEIGDYTKTAELQDVPSVSQYVDKIAFEENYHIKQLKGECSFEKGGCGDLFTRKGFMYFFSNGLEEAGLSLSYDESLNAFKVVSSMSGCVGLVERAIKRATLLEGNTSTTLWNQRQWHREAKAKELAGYNAYGMYHCSYYKMSHIKCPEVGEKHEAYQ